MSTFHHYKTDHYKTFHHYKTYLLFFFFNTDSLKSTVYFAPVAHPN